MMLCAGLHSGSVAALHSGTAAALDSGIARAYGTAFEERCGTAFGERCSTAIRGALRNCIRGAPMQKHAEAMPLCNMAYVMNVIVFVCSSSFYDVCLQFMMPLMKMSAL